MNKPIYNKTPTTSFYKDLIEVVQVEMKNRRVRSNRILHIKAALLILTYFATLFIFWSVTATPFIYTLMAVFLGILCLPIVLNIGHEAVHNTFSKNKKTNNTGKYVFMLLGTSSYFWELRHISSHHAYANVKDWDMDIEQSKLIRLSENQAYEKHHKHQHYYMPIAFCLYTLIWFFFRDFKDISTKQFGAKHIETHPRIELLKLLIAKMIHLSFFIFIPWIISGSLSLALVGFIVFHLSASIMTTFALVSTHVGDEQEIVNNNLELPYSWAEHQLYTTADFGTKSWFTTHFFGGFNHHVAHHLFPKISHIHYPLITSIIEKLASKHGLPYYQYSNLYRTAGAHLRRLRGLSFNQDI